MPDPKSKESKEEFVKRFMSSEEAKKDFPDEKQRLAVAHKKFKEQSKSKEKIPIFKVVKIKEEEEDSTDENEEEESKEKTYTFIGASTLPDRVREVLPDGKEIEGEILSKNVLDKCAECVNDEAKMGGKYGSYRTISLFHNRVINKDYSLEEAGYVKPGSAEVIEMENSPGNYELHVDVTVNEKFKPPVEHEDYTPEKIHYKIEKGAMGLSLEYNNNEDQEKIVEVEGKNYRYVLDTDDFRGFGFARPDLIGNTTAVRIKENTLAAAFNAVKIKNKKGEKNMAEEKDGKKPEGDLAKAQAEIKRLKEELAKAKGSKGEDAKAKEIEKKIEETDAKIKEMQLKADTTATKLKESIELAFNTLEIKPPTKTEGKDAKIKEIYANVEKKDWAKFKELTENQIEANDKANAKIKEDMSRSGMGFDFEKHQTLKVKCVGSQMIVIPTAKTKDVLDASDMAEGTYLQTNAMFADRYVAGITETFLKEDSLLTAMNKEQHIGGNDKYQWRLWVDYTTVTGDNTLAIDPNITSVTRTTRKFEKMETRIVEYRDGVEVTDFTQHHSMAAIGDLLGIELQRAAEAVTESMNADLFKPKTEATTGWVGFIGLIGVADSATYTNLYGKTRSAANRLLDATTANTYVSTSEGISVEVIRAGYEKVLAHGSSIGDIAIAIHPTQTRRLFNSEDAAIRNNILTMSGAPPTFGFDRTVMPHIDGIPMIRDYRCESSAAAADTFVVIDMSANKGFNLIVSKALGARGLAKVGTSEAAYVNFWGATVYKSPRNIFLHDSLTNT